MWLFSPVKKTIQQILADSKGILAADETPATIGKRFAALQIENTEENRRAYREVLFTTPTIANYISGVILQDETIRQSTKSGVPFTTVLQQKKIVVGIKVDQGLQPFGTSPVEKITQGLESLTERLPEYYALGARFAKWRAMFVITDATPSFENIEANAQLLAEYAVLCLKYGIVPIVEPEVLADGEHGIEKTYAVTHKVLSAVFSALRKNGVDIRKILLKPNMIVPGEKGPTVVPEVIAEKTVTCFKEVVPSKVPGIVFLSGGQSEEEACINLQFIAEYGKQAPWQWSFSFGRALQNSALQLWHGDDKNSDAAQALFLRRAMLTSGARNGTHRTI